jgi:hypothetical protein
MDLNQDSMNSSFLASWLRHQFVRISPFRSLRDYASKDFQATVGSRQPYSTNSGGAPIPRCRRDQVPAALMFNLLARRRASEWGAILDSGNLVAAAVEGLPECGSIPHVVGQRPAPGVPDMRNSSALRQEAATGCFFAAQYEHRTLPSVTSRIGLRRSPI